MWLISTDQWWPVVRDWIRISFLKSYEAYGQFQQRYRCNDRLLLKWGWYQPWSNYTIRMHQKKNMNIICMDTAHTQLYLPIYARIKHLHSSFPNILWAYLHRIYTIITVRIYELDMHNAYVRRNRLHFFRNTYIQTILRIYFVSNRYRTSGLMIFKNLFR